MNLPRSALDAIADAEKEGRVVEHGKGFVPPPAGESEKSFMWRVIGHAEARGWKVYHVHFSQRSDPGWPDLVLVRDRVIFAELKAEKGTLAKDQAVWLAALMRAGAEAYVWRPSDWDQISEALK